MPSAPTAWAGCSASARAQAKELKYSPQFFTEEQLAEHDGNGPESMLLLALRSSDSESPVVLDVESGGESFYAPGNPYHVFTGKDCSRAFSLSSLAKEHHHGNMDGASETEWKTLDEWFEKLSAKYPTVGTLLPPKVPPQSLPSTCGAAAAAAAAAEVLSHPPPAAEDPRGGRSSSEESINSTEGDMPDGHSAAAAAPASDAAEDDDWREVAEVS